LQSVNYSRDWGQITQLRRCVILGTPCESFWLQIILEKYFNATFIVQTYHDAISLSPQEKTLLLLATDSFPGGLNEELIGTIKKSLTPMLTICLLEEITPQAEIKLRATGLNFLGSYSFFTKSADRILGQAMKRLLGIQEMVVGEKYILKAQETVPVNEDPVLFCANYQSE